MRSRYLLLLALGVVALPLSAIAQSTEHLNPMITLREKGLPIIAIAHPSIPGGRGGGANAVEGAPPPPPPDFSSQAKETVEYKRADVVNTSGASANFLRYIEAITRAGGSVRTHPFTAKIPNWKGEGVANANAALVRQLNAGHVGVQMQYVETPQEVRDVIKAMRFASVGGTRPDTGIAAAAAYWGLTPAQYKEKADVWPLNKNGELLVTVIIETQLGIDNVRQIAAEPGVGVMYVGYGSLGGVFRNDPAGREAATQKILAACKEYKIPCGFPTNNAAEMEQRYNEGFRAFVMQRRDSAAFGAVDMARKLSGRN